MSLQKEFYISPEVFEKARTEGTDLIYALDGLMNDMRMINENSNPYNYIKRFYKIHKKLHARLGIILIGINDMENTYACNEVINFHNNFLFERSQLLRILAHRNSLKIHSILYAAWKSKDWLQYTINIAESIFLEWHITNDNKICKAKKIEL